MMKLDRMAYLVVLRWPRIARPSKGDSQFLKILGRSSFEARKSAHLRMTEMTQSQFIAF
jgi:hypothetical protein